jgi:hypothetical protein
MKLVDRYRPAGRHAGGQQHGLEELVPEIKGRVDAQSEVDSRVTIQAGAEIVHSINPRAGDHREKTRIVNSYVGPFTSIYHDVVVENCEIERSIVLENSALKDIGVRVQDCLSGGTCWFPERVPPGHSSSTWATIAGRVGLTADRWETRSQGAGAKQETHEEYPVTWWRRVHWQRVCPPYDRPVSRLQYCRLRQADYAGNLDNLLPVHDSPRYAFVRGDIADRAAVGEAIKAHQSTRSSTSRRKRTSIGASLPRMRSCIPM